MVPLGKRVLQNFACTVISNYKLVQKSGGLGKLRWKQPMHWLNKCQCHINSRFLSVKELCRISLAQLYPTTSWCQSRGDSGNFGRSSVFMGSINGRDSSLFASYGAFCTSQGELIVQIDYDKIPIGKLRHEMSTQSLRGSVYYTKHNCSC